MLVRSWNPIREMEALRRQFDTVFDELTHLETQTEKGWMPAVELQETDESLVLSAQLPGLKASDLNVEVTREAVSIKGERRQEKKTEHYSEFRYGSFQRVIPLPVAVENDQVKAEFIDGILKLTLPKVKEARNRVVKVNLGELTGETAPAASIPAVANGSATAPEMAVIS